MKLEHALEILDLVRLGGGGQVIDVKKNPRAIGMMGLAPHEVEATGVDNARAVVNNYLEQYPPEERERIRTELWKDYCDIQEYKEARIDLSFLNEEFGNVNYVNFPKINKWEYVSKIRRLREDILYDETHDTLFEDGPCNAWEKFQDQKWKANKEENLRKNKEDLVKLEEECRRFFPDG